MIPAELRKGCQGTGYDNRPGVPATLFAGIGEKEKNMPEGVENTGSAEAGAQTAGEGQAAPTSAGFDETTIPADVRQKIIDEGVNIGFGRGAESVEKRLRPYVDAAEIFLMDEIDDDTWTRILETSPGFKARIEALHGAEQKAATEGDTETLKRLEALEKQLNANQQSALTSTVNERIKQLAGGDSVKEIMLRSAVTAAADQYGPKDPQKQMQFLSTWTDDHWKKINEFVDGELNKRDEVSKQGYIQGKKEGATKGAEGAGGTPPSPERKEPIGDPDLGFSAPEVEAAATELIDG